MRAVNCLLAVLFLAAASSAVAQEKHLIDPMLPGSLESQAAAQPLKKSRRAVNTGQRTVRSANRHRFPGRRTSDRERLGAGEAAVEIAADRARTARETVPICARTVLWPVLTDASGFFSGGSGLGSSEPGSIGSIKCFSCATSGTRGGKEEDGEQGN